MTAPTLTIRLLGSIELRHGDELIQINRRIERFILYILAVEHKLVSRTTLIDLLWPQAEQMDPRAALRTALSRLRKNLVDPDLIVTEFDTVRLDLNRCSLDVAKFEDYFHSLDTTLSSYQENRTLPGQIVNQVQKALELWRGDRIILGENFSAYPELEFWHQIHNNELTYQRKLLMLRLAEHYQSAGQLELALKYFFLLGQLDVLNVSNHLTVLEILAQLGKHNDVLTYCDDLETVYEMEFNAPLPTAIISKIQAAESIIKENKGQGHNEWHLPLTMRLPMVGRQLELEKMRHAFFSGGIVLIRGEMGTGKTRLVQELLQTLGARNTLFLTSAREMEETLPFSPIIHGLRKSITKDLWLELDCIWMNQLQLLLPELSAKPLDIHETKAADFPTGKQHLLDALYHLFRCLSEKKGKLIFFLDDAQWADSQTIQTISYLISQGLFNIQGLLIIALRPEESNQVLESMIDRFYRTHPIHSINLTGLNPEDLRLLVESAMQKKVSTNVIAQIYHESNGNPFFVLELVRDILDRDQDIETLESMPSLPLPESIRAIIRGRINKFDETARHILLCAAILGHNFSPDLLKAVSNLEKFENIDYIEPLVKSGFISLTDEENSPELTFQLTHEKIRDVILAESTPSSLRILHKRAADYMVEANHHPEQAGVIANHYLASGDRLNAFHWFIKAAQYAWTLGAKDDVLHNYLSAEKIYRDASEGFFSIDDVLSLYEPWSNFAHQSNQTGLLEQIGLKIQFLGERENSPRLLGYAYIALANSCHLRMEFDTGGNLLEKAIDYLHLTNDRKALASAILRKCSFQWWQLDFEGCRQGAELALDVINESDFTEDSHNNLKFLANNAIAAVLHATGFAEKALQTANNVYKQFYHQLNTYDRLRALNVLACAYELTGDYSLCTKFIEEGLEIAKAIDNTLTEVVLLSTRAKALVKQGYLDEAYQDASRALAMGEKFGWNHTIIDANRILGQIFFTLQNKSQALQHYRIAQIRDGFPPKSTNGIENSIQLARVLTMERQIPEARRIIDNVMAFTKEKGLQSYHIQALIVTAFCDLFEDNFEESNEKFTSANNQAVKLGLKYEQVWSLKGLAELAVNQHQYNEAERLLLETLEESEEHHLVWQHLNAWTHYIELMKTINQSAVSDDIWLKFRSMLKEVDRHTQSEALRNDFELARKRWEKGVTIL